MNPYKRIFIFVAFIAICFIVTLLIKNAISKEIYAQPTSLNNLEGNFDMNITRGQAQALVQYNTETQTLYLNSSPVQPEISSYVRDLSFPICKVESVSDITGYKQGDRSYPINVKITNNDKSMDIDFYAANERKLIMHIAENRSYGKQSKTTYYFCESNQDDSLYAAMNVFLEHEYHD
jgi:hypothetical protein